MARGKMHLARKARMPLSKTQVKAVRKIANKQINRIAELKYKDSLATQQSMSYDSPTVSALTFPSQGDGNTSRDGDSIYLKSSQLRFYVERNSVSGSDGTWRVMVVQWLENSGTAPTLSDILQDTSQYDSIHSPYLINGKKEFRVLYDAKGSVSENNGPDHTFRTANLKPRVRKIQFDAAAVTCVGQLYVIYLSNQAAAGNTPSIYWYARHRYLDN